MVVDQSLAYALAIVREASRPESPFRSLSEATRIRFAACRIAAFWTKTRADKWKRDTALSGPERDWDALERVLQEASRRPDWLSRDAVIASARLHDPVVCRDDVPMPGRLTNAHFHLVVPDPDRIKVEQIQALARLRWRGAQASAWQVAVDHQEDGGRLSIREVWIPPSDAEHNQWRVDDRARPFVINTSDLLASMAYQAPRLYDRLSPWHVDRRGVARLATEWHGEHPGLIISRGWSTSGREAVKATVAVVVPESLTATHGHDRGSSIARHRYEAVREWIQRVAPPAAQLATWEAAVDGVQVRATYSGKARASIEVETEDTTVAARVMNIAVEEAVASGGRHREGFAEFSVD
jgi:hypothetical protein